MKTINKGLGLAHVQRDIPSPLTEASYFSKLTLWWMNKHLWRGFRRPVAPTDIYTVTPENRAVHRAEQLQRLWDSLSQEEKQRKNSLLRVTLLDNWKRLALSILLIILGEVCKFSQPFLIAELVGFFKKSAISEGLAASYGAVMVVLMGIYSVVSTRGEFLGQEVAMRMRTSCTALLTRKATRLNRKSMADVSCGTVINLLATDVERFYCAACEFRGFFVGPVVLLTLVILMAVSLELSVLPALAVVFLLTTARICMGYWSSKLRLKWASWTDRRVMLVTEIVQSIKTIKAYCLEKTFRQRARNIRKLETRESGLVVFLNGLNINLGHMCDRLVTFFLVLTYVLTLKGVDYKLAVQILTWMKMGQLGFLNFPIGFSMWKQMEASLSRIQVFLLSDEFMDPSKRKREALVNSCDRVQVTLKNACASWEVKVKNESDSTKLFKDTMIKSIRSASHVASDDCFVATGTFSLRHITLNISAGQHVGIAGPVGSGKTSLLLAILGSLPLAAGARKLKGRVAYVAQQAWLRADTYRNNILMGAPMNRSRYTAVMEACALEKDVSVLPNGDLTKIGEGGSTLCGGQRARIGLARALYRDTDIYIFDDPFTALDSKVAAHIYNRCFDKLLKGKLVLVTGNSRRLLEMMDIVVVLKEGKLLASGTLEQVKTQVDLKTILDEEPSNDFSHQEEGSDIFEVHDKKNMLMSLLSTDHMKKEHAHVPTKRSTPFKVLLSYWLAGKGYITMSFFCLLLLAQQIFSVLGEWWLVYNLAGGYTSKGYTKASESYNKTYGGSTYTGDKNRHGYNGTEYSSVASTVANYVWSTVQPEALLTFTTQNALSGNLSETSTLNLQHGTILASPNDTDLGYAAADAKGASPSDQIALLGPFAVCVWLALACGILSVIAGTSFLVLASRNLYNQMFDNVLCSKLDLFSSNKTGELLNRFTRDTGRMDDIIPSAINGAFLTAAIILTQAGYICFINHYVILATIPFLVVIVLFVLFSIRTIRDTKRIESEFRTPTYEHVQHILCGLETIRAFEMEAQMIKDTDAHLDRHTSAWHLYIGSMYWMKMRLNILVTTYLAVVLLIAFVTPHKEEMATPLGLSLAYILVFMSRVQYCAINSAILDANLTSVEHLYEYTNLQTEENILKDDLVDRRDSRNERDLTAEPCNFTRKLQRLASGLFASNERPKMTSVEHVHEYSKVELDIPNIDTLPDGNAKQLDHLSDVFMRGHITFTNVSVTYPNSKLQALKTFNLTIKPGEKIGITGRTGAGKSTIFNTLLRLSSYSGVITIDGVDIGSVPVDQLRSKITSLLQHDGLHSGSLRQNLDPFCRQSDDDIWNALERVNLKKKVKKLPGRLEMEMDDHGSNFSSGQRQLLCLARGLLNRNKIVLLDEVTSDLDGSTSMFVSRMIREEFQDCTILHISHSLDFLMHYDKILIIESSKVVEAGHPHVLLHKEKSFISSMLSKMCPERLAEIALAAEVNYNTNQLKEKGEPRIESNNGDQTSGEMHSENDRAFEC